MKKTADAVCFFIGVIFCVILYLFKIGFPAGGMKQSEYPFRKRNIYILIITEYSSVVNPNL